MNPTRSFFVCLAPVSRARVHLGGQAGCIRRGRPQNFYQMNQNYSFFWLRRHEYPTWRCCQLRLGENPRETIPQSAYPKCPPLPTRDWCRNEPKPFFQCEQGWEIMFPWVRSPLQGGAAMAMSILRSGGAVWIADTRHPMPYRMEYAHSGLRVQQSLG